MRIEIDLDFLGAPHPWHRLDRSSPVRETRDETEILGDMLLADPACRDDAARREGDRHTEDRLGHEDALGMMPERPVPEIRNDLLRRVDYVDSIKMARKLRRMSRGKRDFVEARMFKVKRATGNRIVVIETHGSVEIDPLCRFLNYLNSKGFSPNTSLAYAHDLVHLWTFLSTQKIHWTNLTPELSVEFLAHLRSVPSGRRRR